MLWLTWQIWILLALAFAGGVMTGWVARNAPDVVPEKPDAKPEPAASPMTSAGPFHSEDEPVKTGAVAEPETHHSEPSPDVDDEPADDTLGDDSTSSSEPGDDLTQIKGLGPRAAEKLQEAGVNSIAQIAAWSYEDVDRFDALINGRGRIIRDSWVEQAKELSA